MENKDNRYIEMFCTQDEEWGIAVIGYSDKEAFMEAQKFLDAYNDKTHGEEVENYLEMETEPDKYRFKKIILENDEYYEINELGDTTGLVFLIIN